MSKNVFSFKGKKGLKLNDNASKREQKKTKRVKSELNSLSNFGGLFSNSIQNNQGALSKAISSTFIEDKKGI